MRFLIVAALCVFGPCRLAADKTFSLKDYAGRAPECEDIYGIDLHKEGMVGGFQTANCSSEGVQKALKVADLSPDDVHGVTFQIVAGTKYVAHAVYNGFCCRVPVWAQLSGEFQVLVDELCCNKGACDKSVKKC